MEHACDRCGVSVEDGVPFCGHCGAPQIRVISTPRDELAADIAGAPDESAKWPDLEPAADSGDRVNWSRGFRSSAIAAVLSAILGFIATAVAGPFLGLLAWTLLSGMLAVAIYRRQAHPTRVLPGAGAKLGALSGLIGFLFVTLLSSVQLLVRGSAEFRKLLEEQLRHSAAASDATVQPWVDYFLSPHGMAVLMLISLVFTLVIFIALSSVGGAIGARISSSRSR